MNEKSLSSFPDELITVLPYQPMKPSFGTYNMQDT